MKSKGVLPDTCAWIDYFKPQASRLKQNVERILANDRVFICGPILYELVQGLRSEKEKRIVLRALMSLDYLEMTTDRWIKAGERAALLRKEGKTIPFSDILVATIAAENDLSILTVDKHFSKIPGIALYPAS